MELGGLGESSFQGAEDWGEQACMVVGNAVLVCDSHGNMGEYVGDPGRGPSGVVEVHHP